VEKIKEFIKEIRNLLTSLGDFVGKNVSNYICASYLVLDLLEKFYRSHVIQGKSYRNLLDAILNVASLEEIFKGLPFPYSKNILPFVKYSNIKKEVALRNKGFCIPEELDDGIVSGVRLIDCIFAAGENRLSDVGESSKGMSLVIGYFPHIDYVSYILYIESVYAKCVYHKTLKEVVENNVQVASFLNCLFGKKEFKECIEEVYVKGKDKIKSVWDEFLTQTHLNTFSLDKVEEILQAMAATIGKNEVLYRYIFPHLNALCTNLCCMTTPSGRTNFNSFCKTTPLAECSESIRECMYCYNREKKEIECSSKCSERCVNSLPEATLILEYSGQSCEKGKENIKCPRAQMKDCEVNLRLVCSAKFDYRSKLEDIKNRRSQLPKLTKEDLDILTPFEKIECSATK
jgi:hypothetical protein